MILCSYLVRYVFYFLVGSIVGSSMCLDQLFLCFTVYLTENILCVSRSKMHSVVSGVILMMQLIFGASKSPNVLFQTDDAFINILHSLFRFAKLSKTLCRCVLQGVITNIFKLPSIAYFSGFICVLFEVNSYYKPM